MCVPVSESFRFLSLLVVFFVFVFYSRQFVRKTATTSVGQKCLGLNCPGVKTNGRLCRGVLHDFVLDWEHSLPEKDLDSAHYHSK